MRRLYLNASTLALALALSCGGSSNPFGDPEPEVTGDDDPQMSAQPTTPETSTPAPTTPTTTPTTDATSCKPERMIVLGDSLTACIGVGGPNGAQCSAKLLYDHMKATHAPNLAYENYSVGGAVTEDVPQRQLDLIPTGKAGHAFVLIYIGGNDLAQYIFVSDQAAQEGYDMLHPRVEQNWKDIFAFFNDETKFPDGATILMNTQYNPFDDCTAPPYNVSRRKTELLHMFNSELVRFKEAHENVLIADQHAPFLGHGHHASVASCPHYMPGMRNWMNDLIHANALGHENFVKQWTPIVDTHYAACK